MTAPGYLGWNEGPGGGVVCGGVVPLWGEELCGEGGRGEHPGERRGRVEGSVTPGEELLLLPLLPEKGGGEAGVPRLGEEWLNRQQAGQRVVLGSVVSNVATVVCGIAELLRWEAEYLVGNTSQH